MLLQRRWQRPASRMGRVSPALFEPVDGGRAARQRSRGSCSNIRQSGLPERDRRPVVSNVTQLRSARVGDMFSLGGVSDPVTTRYCQRLSRRLASFLLLHTGANRVILELPPGIHFIFQPHGVRKP